MKKLLLSLVSVAAISFASVAETVTYDFVNETYGLNRESGNSPNYLSNGTVVDNAPAKIVLNNQNSGDTNWRLWKDGLRATKAVKGEMTITVEGATITGVDFTIANNATSISVNGADAEAVSKGATMNWEGNSSEVTAVFTQTATMAVAKIVITYEAAQAGDKKPAGLSYSTSSVELTVDKIASFEAPTLSNPNNLAVTYTSSDENVAEVSAEGVVTLTGDEGSATIKAEFAGDDNFLAGSASFTITVKPALPANESSEANPYTVAKALEIAKSLDASSELADVYAKGYVIAIKELSTDFGNATYTIADVADATEGLSVFRGYYLNGDKFTAEDQLKVGAEVVVCGTLVNYKGNTPQFTTGSKLISYSYDGGDTPQPEVPSVTTLAEAFALESGTSVVVDCPLTVGFVNNKNIFVCDEAGDFIQIYYENEVKVGDVIPGGWKATYTVRYGAPQFGPAEALPAATEGTFAPKTVAAADVTVALVNHVILVKDVVLEEASPAGKENFTGKVGDVTLNLRNNYTLPSVEAGTYNITMVVTIFNDAPSLYVVNYEKSSVSGIDEVVVGSEADAVYYNLQGVRVDNPANGVYIRVAGSEVSKVFVR